MRAEDIKSDGITFRSFLTLCSHRALVDKGQTYFVAMSHDSSIEYQTSMVDLLAVQTDRQPC